MSKDKRKSYRKPKLLREKGWIQLSIKKKM